MDDTDTQSPPISVFLSYVRADDASFDISAPMRAGLAQLISGFSGRPAQVFVDKHDIPLGVHWQDKLKNAVEQSYFFIPVYTANYVRSDACRDEFLTFRQEALLRGVESLILPVIWLGVDSLLPKGQDEISDYIRDHQAAIFDDAWVQGAGSPAFRANLLKIAKRIIEIVPEVETVLVEREEKEISVRSQESLAADDPSPEGAGPLGQDAPLSEETGLLEESGSFQADVALVTAAAGRLNEAMRQFGELPGAPSPRGDGFKDSSRYAIRIAEKLKTPAMQIEKEGSSLPAAAKGADLHLRNMVNLTRSTESEGLIAEMESSFSQGFSSLSDLEGVHKQLEGLLVSMKTPEALSASLRRALQPARRGVTAVQDALRIFRSWPGLVEVQSTSGE